MKRIIFCVSFLFMLLVGIVNAASQEYFKGKSIRLLIGTSTGGAMDDWGPFWLCISAKIFQEVLISWCKTWQARAP
jgi:hypothetical protein